MRAGKPGSLFSSIAAERFRSAVNRPGFAVYGSMSGTAHVIPFRSKADAFDLEVTLDDVKPRIWRRLRVAASLSLRDLHHVLQIALGWNDSHLHEFTIGKRRFGTPDPDEDIGESPLDERDYELGRLIVEGDRFEYLYDFGDGWRHEIAVKKGVRGEVAHRAECLDGARSGPPDDCGGPGGYQHLLHVLATPRHREHRELSAWVDPDFDAELFDIAAINRELRGAGSSAFRLLRVRFSTWSRSARATSMSSPSCPARAD